MFLWKRKLNVTLPLYIFTIVKDGMPWITMHYPELKKLNIDWQWHCIEGTAAPDNDTSWIIRQEPGLSTDGTTEYLDSIASMDKRIVLHRSEWWRGKVEMVNEPLKYIHEPCILMEIDSDELWTAHQIELLTKTLAVGKEDYAMFRCRYFVGPDIVIQGTNCFGNHDDYEWTRAWKFTPGRRFVTHEPPKLFGQKLCLGHGITAKSSLVFDHMAWTTERQVEQKSRLYGSPSNKLGHLYSGVVDGWHRLQVNQKWPALVRDFLPFVRDGSMAIRL